MATRIHRPLKDIAFNGNGIMKQRYELSKQLQDLYVDVAVLSETHLKPHERFFISNYLFIVPTATRVEKAELSLRLGEALVNSEILLACVYKSPGRAWRDADITELLSIRRRSILAGANC
jgi:hypothetical protein